MLREHSCHNYTVPAADTPKLSFKREASLSSVHQNGYRSHLRVPIWSLSIFYWVPYGEGVEIERVRKGNDSIAGWDIAVQL